MSLSGTKFYKGTNFIYEKDNNPLVDIVIPESYDLSSLKVEEKVNVERYRQNLSKAIQYKTVSYPDPDDMDWAEFERFHAFLDEAYPLTAKHLEKDNRL